MVDKVNTEYVYKFIGRSDGAKDILPEPLYIQTPNKMTMDEAIEEFVKTHIRADELGPHEFTVTGRKVVHVELEEQDFTYDKYPVDTYNPDSDIVTLNRLTKAEAEEKVYESKSVVLWIVPKGVHPLKEGLRMPVSIPDVDETRDVWSNGVELTRFDMKLRLMNEVNFNRADDAPFDFYLIEGDMF